MGILGSRRGRPRISVQTILHRMKKAAWDGFFDELRKIAVEDEEALDAAKRITSAQKDQGRRYIGTTAIGAVAGPTAAFLGDAAGAMAHPKGQRLKALGQAVAKHREAPELARNVAKGAISGSAIQAAREHVQLSDARKTYEQYVREHRGT